MVRKPLWVILAVLLLCPGVIRAQLVGDMIHAAVPLDDSRLTVVGKTAQYSFTSEALEELFTGVALQGFTSSDSLQGMVRFEETGRWGMWHTLYIVRSATDDAFLAAYRSVELRDATRFELRFSVTAGSDVTVLQAGTFDSRRDEGNPQYTPEKVEQGHNFVIVAPGLHPRREWGAEAFRGTPIPLNRPDYRFMTLHHTAGFAATTLAEGLDQVKRIQDFHQNGRGWSDIGYQFLMDQEGRIYQGRPFLNASVSFDDGPPLVQGAHVGGANTGNIGVSLMGCYHPAEGSNCRDEMTMAATDSLLTTVAFLSERYGVSPELMRGHRDFSQTSCPGDNNYVQLSSFRMRVAELLETGNAPLGIAALDARVDSIGVVSLRWTFQEDLGIQAFSIQRKVGESITTLAVRDIVEEGQLLDVVSGGQYEYLLVARGSRNREQVLAMASIEVNDPGQYVLAHNFPNPATDQATIRYFLQASGIVILRIFDLAGREVSRQEQSYKEKERWYTATVNTSELPSGVYYYQIQLEGFANTVFEASKSLVIVR